LKVSHIQSLPPSYTEQIENALPMVKAD